MPQAPDKRYLALLITGDEVLGADITDSNSTLITKTLGEVGLTPKTRRVVGDDLAGLVEAITELHQRTEFVVINGGLGSTVDDLTNQAVSLALGVPLEENSAAQALLQSRSSKTALGGQSIFYKQCLLPQGAVTFHNPVGSALGYALETDGRWVIATPGPPRELEGMLRESILPWFAGHFPAQAQTKLYRFLVLSHGESRLEALILKHFSALAPNPFERLKLGFRAVAPFTEVKVWVEPQDRALGEQTQKALLALLADSCFSQGPELPSLVSEMLRVRKQTLCLAESCTGGLLSSMLTSLAGASEVFNAGVVSYAYEAKEEFLGVRHESLVTQGAVSEVVALEMLQGVIKNGRSDLGIAITGIAGPTGGLPNKPVGTVFVAVGSKDRQYCRRLVVVRERTLFQRFVALTALDLLRRFLLELDLQAPYYYDDLSKSRLKLE
ncbi:MAG: hypothetical protein A2600_09565 [Candidatus Lambdaproteobacteria bacterium RIFOXYD1_FULL_56_27]|uniref:CinA-like protein n=1 Tax=Candidatus Lambdaproteobacteria bacterium RIFOXYD2_FULL_56_26 TaxID=1817773 RepID=A0A1F6GUR1_9PROT|nr:MAG: hypothetical protein A2557_04835 [Candidatus Lambdaproteobacteria bacterium RIFOXYD2_FULL_56_26]OGH02294.1 MAG: hypothetical protein A2426_03315 [Candidatus Lambdaproteobacteria bacterium RIFOXYC1_FULL_56_13]OGH10064.1 MAG: hypothetical protein A2600_09565 [Candidatus Lambdaproteobacteria bacterium RIFOXYD1_FULL_56_27]